MNTTRNPYPTKNGLPKNTALVFQQNIYNSNRNSHELNQISNGSKTYATYEVTHCEQKTQPINARKGLGFVLSDAFVQMFVYLIIRLRLTKIFHIII